MRRWLLLLVPCLPGLFAPAACIGTESGNPSCGAPDCPVTLELDGGGLGSSTTTRVEVPAWGSPLALVFSGRSCGVGAVRGELEWIADEATRTPAGAARLRLDRTGMPASTLVQVGIQGQQYDVVAGELVLSAEPPPAEPRITGELTLRPFDHDAGTPLPRVLVDGELEVPCRETDTGVSLPTVSGDVVVIPCNDVRIEITCDDSPSGC